MLRWEDMRSILAVRLDGLGDLLMTTPALRALKTHRPQRRLTLLTSPAGAVAARELPFIDATIVFAAPWMKHGQPADAGAMTTLVEQLRDGRHGGAVIFTVCTQSPLPAATLCYLAGIPRRLAHVRENPYELINDAVRDPDVDVRPASGTRWCGSSTSSRRPGRRSPTPRWCSRSAPPRARR